METSLPPSAAALLRGVGLDVDGPVRWGTNPTSRAAGIFAVELDAPEESAPIDITAIRRWLDRVPQLRLDGERPSETVLASRLASFWWPRQTLLYIGRTNKSLAARVAAMYATELGHRRPHAGGHWLKTLRTPSRLVLWWAETDAPEEYEDGVLGAFEASIPEEVRERMEGKGPLLPWANLESATLGQRPTGLTASLLDAEATPPRASGVRRSDRGSSPARRAPSSSSTRAPRRSAPRGTSAGGPASGPPRELPTHLTAEGLAALRAELEHLTAVERPQVVERVKHARELGDLRENADYESARNEQSFLEGRILELEHRLRTAVVIENRSGGLVGLGSTVRYEVDGEPGELTIVGSAESDPSAGRISAASPVGKALLGHRAGDEVAVRTPAAEIRYRIVEVG